MRVIKFIGGCLLVGLFAGIVFFNTHRIWTNDIFQSYINGYNDGQSQCKPGMYQSEIEIEPGIIEAIRE